MAKLIRLSVMSAVLVAMMCGSAFAQEVFKVQGSASVSGIVYENYSEPGIYRIHYPVFYVSNITGETIKCKVVVLDEDGNDVSSMGSIYSGGINGFPTTIASGTGEFTLPPHSTRYYSMKGNTSSRYICGQALIQWSSDDPNLVRALTGTYNQDGGMFPINNGQPF